ncbi:MAG: hypothetical protein VYA60_05215 [Pseudomonadota bacterium]|nr:hypothetical protein [Pseudomonadota bacterium]
MGSPNFSHDQIMTHTFGYEPDCEYEHDTICELIDNVTDRLNDIDNDLFEAYIESGYHSGFVIHSQTRGSNYIIAGESKEWMLDEMHALMKEQMQDIDLLESFVDGSHKSIVEEYTCKCDHGCTCHMNEKKSHIALYVLAIIGQAVETYTQFEWVLDFHAQIMIEALNEAGVTFTDVSDIQSLADTIDEVLDPDVLRATVSACIERNLKLFETEVARVAQEFNLQELVGISWTSHLTSVDYDSLLDNDAIDATA